MPDKKIYQLYAMHYSDEAAKEAIKHRFNRINGRYILIYECENTLNTPVSAYHIIDENEIGYLSESEKIWLLQCNVQIITEESLAKQDDILRSFSEKLNQLEQELAKEEEGIENGTDRNQE